MRSGLCMCLRLLNEQSCDFPPHRKEILQEYFDLSSLLQDEVVCVHNEMASALKSIEPHREYESFIQQNR